MPPGDAKASSAATPTLPDGTAGFSGRGRCGPMLSPSPHPTTCPLSLLISPVPSEQCELPSRRVLCTFAALSALCEVDGRMRGLCAAVLVLTSSKRLPGRGRGAHGFAPTSAAPGSQLGEPIGQLMTATTGSPSRGGALSLATEPLQNAKCAPQPSSACLCAADHADHCCKLRSAHHR